MAHNENHESTRNVTAACEQICMLFLGPLVVPIKYLTHCALQVQVCHQRLSGALDFLLIFLCSLIQTLTLTLNPT